MGADRLPGSYDGINCVCSGAMGCVGGSCSRDGGMSWYGADCAGCTCQGRVNPGTFHPSSTRGHPSFSKAHFEAVVAEINTRNVFRVVQFEAAEYNVKTVTQAEWNTLAERGRFSLNGTKNIGGIYDLFGVPHGSVETALTPYL